jgi:hypothetical protein
MTRRDLRYSVACSNKRNTDTATLAPDHSARVNFAARYDQCELIGNARLFPDLQKSPSVRQVAERATGRYVAEPDQRSIENLAARSFPPVNDGNGRSY